MYNLVTILADKKPKVGAVLFIAIDGHGGSGKSILAELLSEKLGAEIIHTDDFSSWDIPFDWNSALITNIFEPIKHGARTLSYDRSKWWDNHLPQPVMNQKVTNIMILEGVGSIRPEFSPYISLNIFVDTHTDISLKRGMARDSETDRTKSEVKELWQKWIKAEYAFFESNRPKDHADIVLDGTIPFESQIVF